MTFPLFHPESSAPLPAAMSLDEFHSEYPRESDVVERKSGTGHKPIQEAVVAFSNTRGGVILIGVADTGEVRGRELTQRVEETLHQSIGEVRNPGRYWIHQVLVGVLPVTIASVAKRVQGFAQTSNGRVLVRRGPRNVALFDSDLFTFVAERSLERFESSPTEVRLERASADAIAAIAKAFDWPDPHDLEDRLQERGLVSPSPDGSVLTVAGALTLDDAPQDALSKAHIEILRFPGEAGEYDRRVQVSGRADQQIQRATEVVADELGTDLVVLGVHRHDLPRLPTRALREAIANAVAHRSYEAAGTATRIEIRPGAVRVVSPGGLPAPVTEQNIREAQSARNPNLIHVLRRLGLAEDAGRGVDVIQDSMMEELLDPPTFRDTGHSVEVTLPVRGGVAPAERAWVKEIEERGEIHPADRVLLVHAARGEELTNARVRGLLHVDRVAATTALQRLRDAGFLVQRGRRGGASYVLAGALSPPAGLKLAFDELQDLVVGLADSEPLTNAIVRERTGLDRTAALRLLDALVAEGRIVRTGTRRGTRYVLPSDAR